MPGQLMLSCIISLGLPNTTGPSAQVAYLCQRLRAYHPPTPSATQPTVKLVGPETTLGMFDNCAPYRQAELASLPVFIPFSRYCYESHTARTRRPYTSV